MNASPELLERLSLLPDSERSRTVFEENPHLGERTTILEIADQVNRIAREDLDKAERFANLVGWLSDLTADEYCRAKAHRCLGNVQVMRSNYQGAIRLLEDSLRIYRNLGIKREQAATLSTMLQPLIYLARYPEAFEKASLAREIAQALGDELLLARIDINFGNILHRLDRFPEAVSSYLTALGTLTRLGQHRDCAVAYLNLAVCYIALNDFNKAQEAYTEARAISVSENMPTLVAQADYNIAYLHYHRGEYSKAIELYRKTRIQCESVGDSLHRSLCDLDQAEIYLDLHLHAEASHLAQQARDAFVELKMPYEATKAMVWLAVAEYQSGKSLRALESLASARDRMQSEGNTVWTATLDLYQALILNQEGRYYEALRECKKAIAGLGKGNPKALYAELVYSSLQLATGRLDEARIRAESACTEAEKLALSYLLANAYLNLGRCQEAQNHHADGLSSYQQSLRWFEKSLVRINAEGLKIPYSRNKSDVYDSVLGLGVRGTTTLRAEEILTVVEKSRAREIAELVTCQSNSLKTPSKNRSVLVEKLRALREELNWYYHCSDAVGLAANTERQLRTDQLGQSIRDRESSLLQTLDAMRQTEEEFYSLQTGSSIPLDQIRSQLAEDETLLELFQSRGSIYALLVTATTCEICALTRSGLLRERLLHLRACFTGLLRGEPARTAQVEGGKTLEILKLLHADLLEPIVGQISGRRLIIAPEGLLRYVPLHALFDGRTFLTEAAIVSYAGGAGLHYLNSKKPIIRKGRDVIVGRPRCGETWETLDFKPLRGVGELQGPENRFVHLHCELSPRFDNPMFSTIKISELETSVLDLFNRDFSCFALGITGVAPGIRADGDGKEFEGLARAFEYAGARALVLQLWETYAEPTELFFSTFYNEASLCEDLAVAFRSALAAVRGKYPDPFCWAPFIFRGHSRPDRTNETVHHE